MVIHFQRFELVFAGEAVFVDADDHILAPVNTGLARGGSLLDHRLGPTCGNRLGHAAFGFDALDNFPRLVDQFLRQRLDVVRTTQRIDDIAHAGFFLDHDLRVARDACGEIGG